MKNREESKEAPPARAGEAAQSGSWTRVHAMIFHPWRHDEAKLLSD